MGAMKVQRISIRNPRLLVKEKSELEDLRRKLAKVAGCSPKDVMIDYFDIEPIGQYFKTKTQKTV